MRWVRQEGCDVSVETQHDPGVGITEPHSTFDQTVQHGGADRPDGR